MLLPLASSVTLFLKILIPSSVVIHNLPVSQNNSFIKYMNKWVYGMNTYLIEVDLFLSALFFFIQEIPQSLVVINFIFAAFMALFTDMFLQNYTIPKDKMHCVSSTFKLILRCISIFSYSFNTIMIITNDIIVFLLVHACISVLLYSMYNWYGFITYHHSTPRTMLLLMICIKICGCFLMIDSYLHSN